MKLLILINVSGRDEYHGTLSRRASADIRNDRNANLPAPLLDALAAFGGTTRHDLELSDLTDLGKMAAICGFASVASPGGRIEIHRIDEAKGER